MLTPTLSLGHTPAGVCGRGIDLWNELNEFVWTGLIRGSFGVWRAVRWLLPATLARHDPSTSSSQIPHYIHFSGVFWTRMKMAFFGYVGMKWFSPEFGAQVLSSTICTKLAPNHRNNRIISALHPYLCITLLFAFLDCIALHWPLRFCIALHWLLRFCIALRYYLCVSALHCIDFCVFALHWRYFCVFCIALHRFWRFRITLMQCIDFRNCNTLIIAFALRCVFALHLVLRFCIALSFAFLHCMDCCVFALHQLLHYLHCFFCIWVQSLSSSLCICLSLWFEFWLHCMYCPSRHYI